MQTASKKYDIIIVGAGHNGLVAAAYLARAGQKVLVLEKNDHVGGAAVSRRVFAEFDARLSEYSYLVSLLPERIIHDLGLNFKTLSRSIASFTPTPDGRALLISNASSKTTQNSFKNFCSLADYEGYLKFQRLCTLFAQKVWPTMLEPLLSKAELAKKFTTPEEKEAWQGIVEEPLGRLIERYIKDDALRGLIFTDARIGVLTHPDDPTLVQNRTFIYHIIGNGTGEWRIPHGGMGALTTELAAAATNAGAHIKTNAPVTALAAGPEEQTITYLDENKKSVTVTGCYVLANVAPRVLTQLLGEPVVEGPDDIEGCQLKINMLLKKLPRLATGTYEAADAFTGTFHVNEGYEAMKQACQEAERGEIPGLPPGEMYCHTLTDPSILGHELQKNGYQTLTFFGLDAPYRLFEKDNKTVKQEMLRRSLSSINNYLAEPIEDCIARGQNGELCVEVKSPLDIEREVGMPKGNIFHRALSWPFAESAAEIGMLGVETKYPHILLCGAGAKRGGAVSGIPGYLVATKVLEGQ